MGKAERYTSLQTNTVTALKEVLRILQDAPPRELVDEAKTRIIFVILSKYMIFEYISYRMSPKNVPLSHEKLGLPVKGE